MLELEPISRYRAPDLLYADSGPPLMSSRSLRRMPSAPVASRWLAGAAMLVSRPALAQEALRNSLAGDTAAEARSRQQESQVYTFRTGDFRLLVTPSLSFDWNDNISLSKDEPLQDYIAIPVVGLNMLYPITQRNMLQLNATFGYMDYFRHHQYSSWYVQSGSGLSFDLYIRDLWINLHDSYSYVQSASQQAAVADTGTFGISQNTIGFNATWDLEDVTSSLGYDHLNYLSTAQGFSYIDHTSEMVVLRGGFKFHPTCTAGLETTTASTAYDQRILNNSVDYSAGVYADWKPGLSMHIQPRFGYTYYQCEQTSQTIPAANQGAWYLNLTVTHDISDAVGYSLSGGHELTLGIYGNTIEDWYIRSEADLRFIKNLTIGTTFSYRDGTQDLSTLPGSSTETYDWLNWGLRLNYQLIKKLQVGINYQFTVRTSDVQSRDYAQNVLGIQFTYAFQ
jgi:hypothetical protein